MNEIATLLDNFIKSENEDSDYEFEGRKVPRVTKILSKCIHNDGLMFWANKLGFSHQSYSKTLAATAAIGTECHENIDAFLADQNHTTPENMQWQAMNAYNSFLKWYNDVKSLAWDFENIMHEQTIICKWFGGTIDSVYRINGKIYLVDYKTSNHVQLNHTLQTAAYRYMLRTEVGIEVDGIIILQLSKDSVSYNEHVLNFDNPSDLAYINDCERAFLSLVYSYYNITYMEEQFKTLNWR